MSGKTHWVFESDTAGKHADDAAALAVKYHGAEVGRASGEAGESYALAVYDEDDALLPWDSIENEIRTFLDHAKAHPDITFVILPGGRPKSDEAQLRFADLFRNASANCELPGRWLEILDRLASVRLILIDANVRVRDSDERRRALDQYFSANEGLWNADFIEVVSFGAAQVLVANDKYARARGYRHRVITVDTNTYGSDSEEVRELLSMAYATKLICVNDPDGTSTTIQARTIRLASSAGLEIDGLLAT